MRSNKHLEEADEVAGQLRTQLSGAIMLCEQLMDTLKKCPSDIRHRQTLILSKIWNNIETEYTIANNMACDLNQAWEDS